MNALENLSDELHRTAKLALDTGEASSVDDAIRIFSAYRVQLVLGPEVAENASLQAAVLTAANCAVRTLLGGVTAVGATSALRVPLVPFTQLGEALEALGVKLATTIDAEMPTVVFGTPPTLDLEPLAVRANVRGWCGGVAPLGYNMPPNSGNDMTSAGVLAGALAVSETFQRLRGHVAACRRPIGINLWQPEMDWLGDGAGPELTRLPSCVWLIGLGNLGQAYLWTLGFLPYGEGNLDLILQDFDLLAKSNVSTSLLTTPALVGLRKSRAMAEWSERRGFRTTIVERRFDSDFRVSALEPPVALVGVDNALARQAIEDVGFERIIEAGLGKGPQDFLGINLHTFPASKRASAVWQTANAAEADISAPAYRELLDRSGDRCGTVLLAGRSIGAPFVGAVAAALAVAELLRLASGGPRYELISCHLRDLSSRTIFRGDAWVPFNPGTVSPDWDDAPLAPSESPNPIDPFSGTGVLPQSLVPPTNLASPS